jgi:hypothetical protein
MRRDPRIQLTRITSSDPQFAAALFWELQVFGIANGYASSADIAAGRMLWYAKYDATSDFYVARDERGELAGMARLIRHDPRLGLRSFSTPVDAASYSAHGEPARCYLDPLWSTTLREAPPHTIAELATQAIVPSYRRFRAMDPLWRAMLRDCRADGVELWTMALVVPLFHFYRSLLPEAVTAIGSVMPDYIGADSIPAALRLDHAQVAAYLNDSSECDSEVSNDFNVSRAVHRTSASV